tara:strand:+ start:370 stop:708 length:339 start_codon:yes stop_codon:yes gene_type:complete
MVNKGKSKETFGGAEGAHTWIDYRTPDHKCSDREKNADEHLGDMGVCGPLELLYEWIMGIIDWGLKTMTGDLNINTTQLWEWFMKLLAIFIFLLFFGIIYKLYNVVSILSGN